MKTLLKTFIKTFEAVSEKVAKTELKIDEAARKSVVMLAAVAIAAGSVMAPSDADARSRAGSFAKSSASAVFKAPKSSSLSPVNGAALLALGYMAGGSYSHARDQIPLAVSAHEAFLIKPSNSAIAEIQHKYAAFTAHMFQMRMQKIAYNEIMGSGQGPHVFEAVSANFKEYIKVRSNLISAIDNVRKNHELGSDEYKVATKYLDGIYFLTTHGREVDGPRADEVTAMMEKLGITDKFAKEYLQKLNAEGPQSAVQFASISLASSEKEATHQKAANDRAAAPRQ